jgi:hypothetical protein
MFKNDQKGPGNIKDTPFTKGDTQYYGICTTCNDASTCLNARNSKNPTWFCEQFDDYSAPKVESFDMNSYLSSLSKEKYSENYKGLCMNCENRHTCAECNTQGGIWHCENYV